MNDTHFEAHTLPYIRRQIIENDISPNPLTRDDFAGSLSTKFGLAPESIPAYRAHLAISARDAMREYGIEVRVETDLKVLALQYIVAKEMNQSNAAFRSHLVEVAKRLEVLPKTLFKAVDAFSRQLAATGNKAEENPLNESTHSPRRNGKYRELSAQETVQVRTQLLNAFLDGDVSGSEDLTKKVAKEFRIGERQVIAQRAWVEKIFLHRAFESVPAMCVDESKYPDVLRCAAQVLSDLNRDLDSPLSQKSRNLLQACASAQGLSQETMRKVIGAYLKNFKWYLELS